MLAEQVSEMLSRNKQHYADQVVRWEIGDAAVPPGFRTG
jgi:hypothetical protein